MSRSRWAITSPTALLVILALINFLNYVDRMVISGLVPFLQDRRDGLGLTSSEVGLLQGAFMVVHSLASIPLGLLADRFLRRRLIAIGVGLWSLATAAAGFAANFLQIFVARAAVGIGEATYAPAASALISDRFKPEQRARALGAFQLGMVLGGAVGFAAERQRRGALGLARGVLRRRVPGAAAGAGHAARARAGPGVARALLDGVDGDPDRGAVQHLGGHLDRYDRDRHHLLHRRAGDVGAAVRAARPLPR
jgi:MFS family permease